MLHITGEVTKIDIVKQGDEEQEKEEEKQEQE